jgi:hypothetical protein
MPDNTVNDAASVSDAPALVPDAPALVPDSVLLASVDAARAALLEITPATTIGEPIGHVVEDEHVLSLLFESTLPGYPGWRWTVTLSRIDDESEPTVLETELTPGERALLAPDWVPWSERLADYEAAQEALRAEEAGNAEGDDDLDDDDADEDDDDLDDDDDDDLDDDDDDDDDDDIRGPALHSGDIDGVDIDELAAPDAEVDEPDDAEGEPDDDGPQPPQVAAGDEFTRQ